MHRRAFLRSLGAGAGAGLVLAARRRARADIVEVDLPRIDVLAGVSVGAAALRGARVDRRTDGGRDFVRVGANLNARSPHIFAADNTNTRFHVWTMIDAVPDGAWPYLDFDGGPLIMASSMGADAAGHDAVFDVGADDAERFGRAWRTIPAQRTPLDGGLTYAWSNPGAAARGKPVRIQLEVTNGGTTPVRFAIGGRQRGPRDNRFSFVVRARGVEVAQLDGPDFGGKMLRKRLGAGERVTVEADLRAWVDRPGVYDVACTYTGEVTPDLDEAGDWPGHAAQIWDVAPTGTLRVAVP